MKNYYAVLNINKDASVLEIKKAYRILAVKYHPDKNHGNKESISKFIEIKEAYDTLINPKSRITYDIEFSDLYSDLYRDEVILNNQVKNREEEQSNFNKEEDTTPKYKPSFDISGKKISENIEFFKYPENIGIIIGAYSNLEKGWKPITLKQKFFNVLQVLFVLSILLILIYLIFQPELNKFYFWVVVFSLVALYFAFDINTETLYNYFLGSKGFAKFESNNSKENITEEIEVNFKNITDLFILFTEVKKNFEYNKTTFKYIFFCNGKKVHTKEYDFNKEEVPESNHLELSFYKRVDYLWSNYLLDTIEEKLQKDGYIKFNLYRYGRLNEYIRIGINEITFIKDSANLTYKYNDIKSVYSKGNLLHIEHNNYIRKSFFKKSGNCDIIPLLDLCNRSFFYKCFEIFLGYKL